MASTQFQWSPHVGSRAVVHAAYGSFAETIADRELSDIERVIVELESIFKPQSPEQFGRVEVYLTDPVPEAPGVLNVSGDGSGTPSADFIGANGIVRFARAEGSPPVAGVVTRLLVHRWFGEAAATADPFIEGIAGLVAARTGTGPGLAQITERLRNDVESGKPVSVLAPAEGDGQVDAVGLWYARTSFVAYLVEATNQDALGEFLRRYQPDRRDEAVGAVFHQPLGALEEDWLGEATESRGDETIMSHLKFLAPLMKPYIWRYMEVILYMAVSVLTTLMLPLVSGCVVSSLSRSAGGPGAAEPSGFCGVIAPTLTTGRVIVIALGLIVLNVIDNAILMRRTQVEMRIFKSIGMSLQERMFARLQRLSHRFYGKARVGDLMSRLSDDLKALEDAMMEVFGSGVLNILTSASAATAALLNAPLVAVIILLLIPAFVLTHKVLGGRIAKSGYEVQKRTGEVQEAAQENLSAHAVVKAFGLEDRETANYARRLQASLKSLMRTMLLGQLFGSTISVVVAIAQVGVLGIGSILVINGTIDDPGTIVTLLLLLPSVFIPITSLTEVGETLEEASGSMIRASEIFKEPIDIEDAAGARPADPLQKKIVFGDVTFGYEPQRPILKNLNLTIPAGKSIALVGPSGSGKSTIVNLLMRFWDPDGGRITFDGHDMRQVTVASLRGQMGIVFQDTFIFNTTVRENIAIGRLDASDEEVRAAAEAARLQEFVSSMPAGYDSVLGERGVRMSGGQRQRLAIARALLRNPNILILDEATSALDARTEAEILDTLKDVTRNRTTVTITHRLAMAAAADIIFVLEKGSLVEQGSHDELVSAGGLYQKLYEEQTAHVTTRPRVAIETARLRTVPLFANLSEEVLTNLAGQLMPDKFASGDDIVSQGDRGDKLFLIMRGEVEVLVDDESGERRVNTLKEGDYFGEYALLTGEDRTATVRAMSPVEVAWLDQRDFFDLLENEAPLRDGISEIIKDRTAAYAAAAEAVGLKFEGEGEGGPSGDGGGLKGNEMPA